MIPTHLLGGRYRVEQLIGLGGMSVVWRATDELLDRPVAIKVLAEDQIGVEAARSAIRAEAQLAARLSHPHVASVYDVAEGEDEHGQPVAYIVLELLNGQSLADRLADGPLPVDNALQIAAEVAGALTAAHALGLVHRDVKPGNIMLTPFGAKVFDFGIAATAGDREKRDQNGRILGTPSFVAPERLAGAPVTAAADVYAFGVLLRRLLGPTDPGQPTLPVPPEVALLCRRCQATDPASRPGAAEAEAILSAARRRTVAPHPSRGVAAVPPAPPVPPAEPELPVTGALVAGRPGGPGRGLVLVGALVLVAVGLSVLLVAVGHGAPTAGDVATPSGATASASPSSDPQTSPPSVLDSFAATVTAACRATDALISALDPKPGYELEAAMTGPAAVATAELRRDRGKGKAIKLTVSCHDGNPTLDVDA